MAETGNNRRDFLRTCAAAGAWAGITPLLAGADTGGGRKPNVVLIIGDDMGFGNYGFMANPVIMTPHLDRLAGESMVFTRGYLFNLKKDPKEVENLAATEPRKVEELLGLLNDWWNPAVQPTGTGADRPNR